MKKPTKAMAGPSLVPIDGVRWAAMLSRLPPTGQAVVQRLLDAVVERGGDLPRGMLKELQGISIEGVDPMWQVAKLQGILDRWLRLH